MISHVLFYWDDLEDPYRVAVIFALLQRDNTQYWSMLWDNAPDEHV